MPDLKDRSRLVEAASGDHQGDGIYEQSTSPDDIAERATVGALLLSPRDYAERILSAVQDSDFASPRCHFTIGVIRAMHAVGTPVDIVTVTGHVQSRGLLTGPARITFGVWLHETAELAPVPASGTWYARCVVEQAARRRTEAAGQRIVRLARGADIDELLAAVRDEFVAAADLLKRAVA